MIGETISHYRILERLGEGGMGVVYAAEDTRLDRKVAVKFLPREFSRDTDYLERFQREARAASALNHPNICTVYDIGDHEGQPFLVMELLEGGSLRDRMTAGGLSVDETLAVVAELADALDAAHAKGILHRDIKPANIQFSARGRAKILDFGVAKVQAPGMLPAAAETRESDMSVSDRDTQPSQTGDLTRPGQVIGTVAYMSPEQARGRAIDTRSDIFSLGILLVEMLSGKHPYKGVTDLETVSAILKDPVPVLPKAGNRRLTGMNRILGRALAKAPSDRYQKAGEMAADLRKLRERLSPGRRRAWIASTATAVALLLLVSGIWFFSRRAGSEKAVPSEPISVLVADFENRTGDPVFDHSLEQAMTIDLESASFISSYKRARARKVAATIQEGAQRLDEKMSRLVAQREGINVVVSGSIEGRDPYRIRVQVVDALTGETLVQAEREIEDRGSILSGLGELALKARTGLGDVVPESVRLAADETFTAASLEAAQKYAIAQELMGGGQFEDAIREFEEAVKLDPEFGRAYSGLGAAYFNTGKPEESEKYYKMALARIDRMTEREKLRTRAVYYITTKKQRKAIEELEKLVERYPADLSATSNLAVAYFYAHDMRRAVEIGKQAVRLFPDNTISKSNLSLFAMVAGDFAISLSLADEVLKINPHIEEHYVWMGLAHLALGRRQPALEAYHHLEQMSPRGASLAAACLADLALYEGRLADAAGILEKGIREDQGAENHNARALKLLTLAKIRLQREEPARALEDAELAVKISQQPRVSFEAAQVFLRAGKAEAALAIARQLGGRLEVDIQAYGKLIEGELQGQGNATRAIELFGEAIKLADSWLAHFLLGRAYLEAGAFAEAHAEFELCLARKGEATTNHLDDLPTYHYLPPVHYYLGRAREGLGSSKATESYRRYLEIKKDAQGDPLAEDARRRIRSSRPAGEEQEPR